MAVEPEWLTELLRADGILTSGSVEHVDVVSSRPSIASTVTRLAVRYSDPTDAPARLFLKTTRPDFAADQSCVGRREVAFYRDVASRVAADLVPRCYAAVWNERTHDFVLLLDDLSATHAMVTEWPLPPAAADCQRILDIYARLHGNGWNHPQLGATIGSLDPPTTEWFQDYERRFASFADELGDRLSAHRRAMYERAIACGPRLLADRYRGGRPLTVIHGDAHVWNSLHARDGDVRLVDWDHWRVAPATDDLAYMIALHWYPERRQRLERDLLACYHRSLQETGVADYDRDALADDYRRSVVRLLGVPVFQHAAKVPAEIWWNHLERITAAFDDLGCADLLA
jgi:thiamine kinase-like enzyme